MTISDSQRRAAALEILRLVEESEAGAANALDLYCVHRAGLAPETVADRRGIQTDSLHASISRATGDREASDLLTGAQEDSERGESGDE